MKKKKMSGQYGGDKKNEKETLGGVSDTEMWERNEWETQNAD